MRGFDCLISVGGQSVAAQINATLNRSQRVNDVTNRIEMAWENYLASTRGWSVSANGCYVVDDAALKSLEQAFMTGQDVEVTLNKGSSKYKGTAIITSFPMGVPFNQEVTYSITLQGKGELSNEG